MALSLRGYSQNANDPHAGSRLVQLGIDSYRFTWPTFTGVHYLVDVSVDLTTWTYITTLFDGSNGFSRYVDFNAYSGNRLFVRLNKDPFNTDSDADGMPDGWEVIYGLDARFNGDAALDPDVDGYTNLEEYALGLGPHFNEYGNGQRTQIYTYDNASRITNVNSSLVETFTYDEEGNLTNSQ